MDKVESYSFSQHHRHAPPPSPPLPSLLLPPPHLAHNILLINKESVSTAFKKNSTRQAETQLLSQSKTITPLNSAQHGCNMAATALWLSAELVPAQSESTSTDASLAWSSSGGCSCVWLYASVTSHMPTSHVTHMRYSAHGGILCRCMY